MKEPSNDFLKNGDKIILSNFNFTLNCINSTSNPTLLAKSQSNQFRKVLSYVYLSQNSIQYGQKIYLKHLLSEKYLTCYTKYGKNSIYFSDQLSGESKLTFTPMQIEGAGAFRRKININDKVILRSLDGESLKVELGSKVGEPQGIVVWDKDESSQLQIKRVNSQVKGQGYLGTFSYYLISSQQDGSIMSLASQQQKAGKAGKAIFSDKLNHFGSFVTIEPSNILNQHDQAIIKYGEPYFIKFRANSCYLGATDTHDIVLYNEVAEDCQFIFEQYNQNQLKESAPSKIRHHSSGRYLSICRGEAKLEVTFKLPNIFKLTAVTHVQVRKISSLNQIYFRFQALCRQRKLQLYKNEARALTNELIRLIYRTSFKYDDYFGMKGSIYQYIDESHQNLLSEIGFLELMLDELVDIFPKMNQLHLDNRIFYQELIANIMILVVGMCHRHSKNGATLKNYLVEVVSNVFKGPGLLEGLYFLCQQEHIVEEFEKQRVDVGSYKISLISSFIKKISQLIDLKTSFKIKILTFLENLVTCPTTEKNQIIEQELIQALKRNQLDSIIIQIKDVDDEIFIQEDGEDIELSEIFQKKNKFSDYAQMIQIQFNFICALFKQAPLEELQYFKTMISQEAALHYIKMKLNSEDKRIFLKILNEVYFSQLPKKNKTVIAIQGQKLQLTEEQSPIIVEIKKQFITAVKYILHHQLYDESLYLYLESFRHFYYISAIDIDEWEQLHKLLQGYLLTNFEQIKQLKAFVSLSKQILKFYQCTMQFRQDIRCLKLIEKIASQHSKHIGSPYLTEQEVQALFYGTAAEASPVTYQYVSKLMIYSINNNRQLFSHTCEAWENINSHLFVGVKKLTSLIMIDNQQLTSMVNNMCILKEEVQKLLVEYRKLVEDQTQVAIRNQMISLIEEINSFFFWKQQENSGMLSLVQNIMRELGVFDMYINCLLIQKKRRRYEKYSSLKAIFQFMRLFIQDNPTNIHICLQSIKSIKWTFQIQDLGQAKFIYSVSLLGPFNQPTTSQLINIALEMLKNNQYPSFYSIATLIKLTQGCARNNSSLEVIENQIISNPELVDTLLMKKGQVFIQQQDKPQQANYCPFFHYYIFCVIRLFLLLAQSSSKKIQLTKILRQKIGINLIFQILLHKDLFENESFSQLGTTILKQEVISYFMQIQQPVFQELQEKEVIWLRKAAFAFLTRILTFQYYNQPQKPSFDLQQTIFEVAANIRCPQNDNINVSFHYIVVCVFFPFALNTCFRMTEMIGINYLSEELSSLYFKCFRKIKQLLTVNDRAKLEYQTYKADYTNAVSQIQKIIKYKITIDSQDQLQLLCHFKPQTSTAYQKIYRDSKIHCIVDNTLATIDINSPSFKVYRALLVLVYSPNIRKYIQSQRDVIEGVHNWMGLQKIIAIIAELKFNKIITAEEALRYITMFANKCSNISRYLGKASNKEFQKLMANIFYNPSKQANNNVEVLFIKLSTFLMKATIDANLIFSSNIMKSILTAQRYNLTKPIFEFIEKQIHKQKKLYDTQAYQKQLKLFVDRSSHLNISSSSGQFQIQQVLAFLLLVMKFFPQNKNGFKNIFQLILQLVRSYVAFIQHFSMKYIPKQLCNKLKVCLEIISCLIAIDPESHAQLIQVGRYFKQFTRILQLDDTYQNSKESVLQSEQQNLESVISTIESTGWLTTLAQICEKSEKLFGRVITYKWGKFPLQNMPFLFGPLKRKVILIFKQIQIRNTFTCQKVIRNISQDVIRQNICIVYYKYFELFCSYDVNPKSQFKDSRLQALVDSLCFQNGIDLTSLKMYRDALFGNRQLEQKYIKYSEKKKKGEGKPINESHIKVEDSLQVRMSKILAFFFSKMGRVQLIIDSKLLVVEFWIPPQCCFMFRQIKKRRFRNISFVSTQLKMDSIKQNCIKFHTIFDSYHHFMDKYVSAKMIANLQVSVGVIKVINLLLIYAATVVLLTDNRDDPNTIRIQSTKPFTILLIINLVVALLYFFAYCTKNTPVFIGKFNNNLRRSTGEENERGWKRRLRWVGYLLQHKEFVYNVLFLIVMCFTFLQKVLIALLAIDLLVHLPKMKILFQTVWRSKGQIVFAILAFYIFSYYYAIIAYRLFVTDKMTQFKYLCRDLGQCFTRVMVLNFRYTGGFAGYLYRLQHQKITSDAFHFFDVFSDIYLILFFLVLPSILFAVLLNELSKTTHLITESRNNIEFDCLVCGLSRTVFNSSSHYSFRIHVSAQHNIEHYYYYYHYVSKKDSLALSTYEQEIILKKESGWLPVGFARGFKQPQLLDK